MTAIEITHTAEEKIRFAFEAIVQDGFPKPSRLTPPGEIGIKSLFLILALFIGPLFQTAWAEEQKEQPNTMVKEILAFADVEGEVAAIRLQLENAAKVRRGIRGFMVGKIFVLADPETGVFFTCRSPLDSK